MIIMKSLVLYLIILLISLVLNKEEIINLVLYFISSVLGLLIIIGDDIIIYVTIITVLWVCHLSYYYLQKNMKVLKPIVIIKNGHIIFENLRKVNCSLDYLLNDLKKKHIDSIEEVNYALFNNGKIEIFKQELIEPQPIIVDGHIDYFILKKINKDLKWLNGILKQEQVEIDNVFYAFYTNRKTFIIKKS